MPPACWAHALEVTVQAVCRCPGTKELVATLRGPGSRMALGAMEPPLQPLWLAVPWLQLGVVGNLHAGSPQPTHPAKHHILMPLPRACPQDCEAERLAMKKEGRPVNLVPLPECHWWVASTVTDDGRLGPVALLAQHLSPHGVLRRQLARRPCQPQAPGLTPAVRRAKGRECPGGFPRSSSQPALLAHHGLGASWGGPRARWVSSPPTGSTFPATNPMARSECNSLMVLEAYPPHPPKFHYNWVL